MPSVINFPQRRPRLAQLMEPDRRQDDALLRVIRGFEDRGKTIVFPGESLETGEAAGEAPTDARAPVASSPFVSPQLERLAAQVGTRTEAECRALRASQTGKAHSVFESILKWWGGQ